MNMIVVTTKCLHIVVPGGAHNNLIIRQHQTGGQCLEGHLRKMFVLVRGDIRFHSNLAMVYSDPPKNIWPHLKKKKMLHFNKSKVLYIKKNQFSTSHSLANKTTLN